MHARTASGFLAVIAIVLAIAALTACGGTEPLPTQKAGAFLGGALSNFGGTDGADPDARNVARAIASSRTYDFTTSGFLIGDGAITSEATPGTDFGHGTGVLLVVLDTATAEVNVAATDARYTLVQLVGTFRVSEAQQAVDSPGASFVVDWSITFQEDGEPYALTAQQTLSGTDWTEI